MEDDICKAKFEVDGNKCVWPDDGFTGTTARIYDCLFEYNIITETFTASCDDDY